MRRRSFLASLGAAVAGSVAGCSEGVFGSTVTESFSSDYAVSPETTVAVRNRNGEVTVSETDGDRLAVSGEKEAGSESGLDSIEVDVVTGEAFVVEVRFGSGSNFERRSVELTVEVPEGIAVDEVRTDNGDVTVEDVRGDVRATTSNGSVEVTDVSGYVGCESANGNVRARGTTGLTGARTINGNVDVEVLAMREDVTCRTSNGNVTVRVGPDVAAGISLETGNGSVEVRDLEFTATTARQRSVEGRLRGADDPVLSGRSSNGDVTLRPA